MINLIATCPEEAKPYLRKELTHLGATDLEDGFRAIAFKADERTYYKIHLYTRIASRILRVVKEFSAAKNEIVFDQTRRINWDKFFDHRSKIIIDSFIADKERSKLTLSSLNDKVREGILRSYSNRKLKEPTVSKREPDIGVVAYVANGRCTLSIDSSGMSLHKRGYRLPGHPAPLKETLAATVLSALEYDGTRPFWDAMSGSGTVAIEAAMMSLNQAPMILRPNANWGFEHLLDFNRNLWREVHDEARSAQRKDLRAPIYASDISDEFVKLSRDNALRARVERFIDFKELPMENAKPKEQNGIIFANLPYGERIGKESELGELYEKIGDNLKKNFKTWTAAILVPADIPPGCIGLKPKRKIHLLNGDLKVKLLIYDLY